MLVVVILIALALLGVLGYLVLGRTARLQKKAEQDADRILDTTFDGSPNVTVKVNMTTLKYETFVNGATIRGYKLAHQADNQYGPHTLIFEKA